MSACLIKTGIRANLLGEGTVKYKLVEGAIGILTQSPEAYAKRMVPLLFAPELEERTRPHLKPTNKSWRADETYVRIKGRWFYLYRAIDSAGATIDFFLSAFRSAAAAKALLAVGDSKPDPKLDPTELAAYTLTAGVILNLDETITKE